MTVTPFEAHLRAYRERLMAAVRAVTEEATWVKAPAIAPVNTPEVSENTGRDQTPVSFSDSNAT
jgi:hypothetical protein